MCIVRSVISKEYSIETSFSENSESSSLNLKSSELDNVGSITHWILMLYNNGLKRLGPTVDKYAAISYGSKKTTFCVSDPSRKKVKWGQVIALL